MNKSAEELKEAYAILDGIPQERFNLGLLCTQVDRKKISCTTIACGVGWLLHHPRYTARGFGYSIDGLLKAPGQSTVFGDGMYFAVGARMFGISENDAEDIFNGRTHQPPHEHKDLLLSRIRRYIERLEAY